MNHAVIMAGGSGTRLWPLSRESCPKQSLRLIGERTMFQNSVDRALPIFPIQNIWVVASPDHASLLHEQVPEIREENLIIEPEARGTAPAIGLAALHLQRKDPEAVMTVLTADHHISNIERFRRVLVAAAQVALGGYLVTLGITPTHPSTGYGYIEQGASIGVEGGFPIFRIHRFTEKPDRESAECMITSGRFAWNSGMFIWQVKRILEEFKRQMNAFYEQLVELDSALNKLDYQAVLQRLWPQVAKQTIDYGVMEGGRDAVVIPVEMGWIDIGSWSSLVELIPTDSQGNTWVGSHVDIDTHNTLSFCKNRLIATIGVRDMVIVDTEDVLLVCPNSQNREPLRVWQTPGLSPYPRHHSK